MTLEGSRETERGRAWRGGKAAMRSGTECAASSVSAVSDPLPDPLA